MGGRTIWVVRHYVGQSGLKLPPRGSAAPKRKRALQRCLQLENCRSQRRFLKSSDEGLELPTPKPELGVGVYLKSMPQK
jgi:hypothetical protein